MFFSLFFVVGVGSLVPAVYFDYVHQEQGYALIAGELLLGFVVIFHGVLSLQFGCKLYEITQSVDAGIGDVRSDGRSSPDTDDDAEDAHYNHGEDAVAESR